uniref:F-box/LRR-repeat protein 3 n=1 Tax=Anthurium amnicola TaxID=1678845 RepID=A0A1D1Y7S0_9ARAE
MKKLRAAEEPNYFDALTEEILFMILDRLDPNPLDKKSFSLVCRSFYAAESHHRRVLTPLRSDLLPTVLARYPSVSRLDLSLCPRVTDASLAAVALSLRPALRSIDLSRSRSFTHAGLESLVANCRSLVDIDLSNATDLSDAAAAAIGRARNLQRLSLARCKMVTDMGLGCIAVGCPRLRVLCLKWCLGVTDLGVGLVAVKCKEIQTLDISYVQVTKKCLPPILQLKHLQDLSLVGCHGIDDESLATLQQECKSLATINLSNCQHIGHVGLSSLTKGAINLRELILAYCGPVSHSLAYSLQKLSKLQSIKLDGCPVTSLGLKAIGNSCASLRELSLSKCPGVTDEGLSFVTGKNKELAKLDITCCRKITGISIASITTSCTSLKCLKMESCSLVSRDAFILIGERCHLLEELDLTDNELDDEGLKAISRCSRISILKVGICLNISDEGVIDIGMCCPDLQEIDLYRSAGITDKSVAAIAQGCPSLQTINLSYCTEITNSSLKSLSKCLKLNTLEIRGCPRISSLGLSAIAVGCRQLAKLDVKNCFDINDVGMIPVARLSRNLRQINLSYCSVTDLGLLALASISCLQNMTILHVRGLTANGLAATLLACVGLTKVKLHSSFRSLLSQNMIEHIEARGCLFQWRDKSFQVEADPIKIWKPEVDVNS